MSEKQISKAEELLELISSPVSLSQQEQGLEEMKEKESLDNFCVEETEPDVSQNELVNTDNCQNETSETEGTTDKDTDTIACHAFLMDTENDACGLDIDSQSNLSESEIQADEGVRRYSISEAETNPRVADLTKYDGAMEAKPHWSDQADSIDDTGTKSALSENMVKLETSHIVNGKSKSDVSESEATERIIELEIKYGANVETQSDYLISETKFKVGDSDACTETKCDNSESEVTHRLTESETNHYSNTGTEVYMPEFALNRKNIKSETNDIVEDTDMSLDLSEWQKKQGVESETDFEMQETKYSSPSQGLTNTSRVQELEYEEIKSELKSCKEELLSTKRHLTKVERQLEKANNYNEDLRKQVESLSAEIHRYRHSATKDADIQVDKDELLIYASGEMVLPDWGTTGQASSNTANTSMDVAPTNQEAGGEKLSIAESLKATAEAVVLQQSGFVYDENYGLYYDYNSGYYYDNEKSLYYDPNSGTYFYYNHETNEYQFHSQVDVTCYQWQHQSGVSSSQHGESGGTTPFGQNKSCQDNNISSQYDIVSKEELKKAQKQRKKEKKKKKEKDKDEKVMNEDVEEILSGFEDMKISTRKHGLELAGGWPPCIRVIVTESTCLNVGTLFIVTCTGGTVGREKDMNHTIRIPDLNVSKMHAEIQFDGDKGQYKIIDRGSQNGTFINDQRIAEAKATSQATPINHGDVLQLGDTKLLCHIHTGSDTCIMCEPGIVIANHLAKQPQKRITVLSKEEKKQQQKKQLKQIKIKYGLKNAAYVDNTKSINNPQYTDKASERRKTVGSDNPEFVKREVPASVHRPISSENIGHKLLKKMGWSEGESLGKENTGIHEPVTVSLRANQSAGLGSSTSAVFSPDDANSLDVRKAARRVQAQHRFNKINTDTVGNQSDKPQTVKQWTKGETQFADGGNI